MRKASSPPATNIPHQNQRVANQDTRAYAMEPTTDVGAPSLPGNCQFVYLNEGAANIVYKIIQNPTTPPPTTIEDFGSGTPPPSEIEGEETSQSAEIHNKLLRLRKDIPTTPQCAIAQTYWEQHIQPFFEPSEIVNQSLFRLEPELVSRLSDDLRAWENEGSIHGGTSRARPEKRQGTYLASDDHGLLVTDMTPGQYFVEFKPKWLVQSPSAPKTAKRCRTCALAAQTKASAKPGDTLKSPLCPLDLISNDPRDVERAAALLSQTTEVNTQRLVRWLQNTRLLHNLRILQYKLDRTGVLEADARDPNLLAAMTLRDCTAFVRFPTNPEDDDLLVEARLGDLDLKGHTKEAYWRSTEAALISEGWYDGTEDQNKRQPLTCNMSRSDKAYRHQK